MLPQASRPWTRAEWQSGDPREGRCTARRGVEGSWPQRPRGRPCGGWRLGQGSPQTLRAPARSEDGVFPQAAPSRENNRQAGVGNNPEVSRRVQGCLVFSCRSPPAGVDPKRRMSDPQHRLPPVCRTGSCSAGPVRGLPLGGLALSEQLGHSLAEGFARMQRSRPAAGRQTQRPGSSLCFCLAEAGSQSESLPSPGCGGRNSPWGEGQPRWGGRQFPLEANTSALTRGGGVRKRRSLVWGNGFLGFWA